MSTASAMRAYKGHPFFSIGLRPFFLLSAIWAGVSVPIWLAAFSHGGAIDLSWHVHEMLFGYTGGVIVGFLMTAVPNWTGRMPVVGAPLAAMTVLWTVGRLAMLAGAVSPDFTPRIWLSSIDILFLMAMAAMVWREVVVGRNWRNVPVAVMVSVLALSNVGFHLEVGLSGLAPVSTRIALSVVAMMIALIGGRITPSFTRNWQLKRGGPLPALPDRLDQAVLVLTLVALVSWNVSPESSWAGSLLAAAGLFNLLRLARWKGYATLAEPLVLILHMGYFWLASGLGLIGLSLLAPSVIPPSAGVHALTAGGIGVMTLAVMTRASRGHTGRSLTAGAAGGIVYLLVNAAALLRLIGGIWVDAHMPFLIASGVCWSAAFLAFALAYGGMLIGPRPASQR